MQLSRGWWKLLLSWAVAVSLCVISGGMLRFVVPVNQKNAAAVEQHPLPAAIENVGNSPTTTPVDPLARSLPAEDSRADLSMLASRQDTLWRRDDILSSPPAPVGSAGSEQDNTPPISNQEKRLNLRITRDNERCPKVVCYKWHLVSQRLKPPQFTKVELSGLHLTKSLQRDVEDGSIDLFIDAVAQHRTINGHDTLIFVATNLAGVTPHDAPH